MEFWKLQGIGNDFIAIDGRNDDIVNNNYGELAKKVCHRRFSVGADGLLVVKNSDVADVEMVYYNACVEMDLDVLQSSFMTII